MTDRVAAHLVPEPARDYLNRLGDAISSSIVTLIGNGPDPAGSWQRIVPLLAEHPDLFVGDERVRLVCALVGSSRALARVLLERPELMDGAPDGASVPIRVQAALLAAAGSDLAGLSTMDEATRQFTQSIDEIVTLALAITREEVASRRPAAMEVPFAVVAMGKWGAQELNYSSDIDLMFVHDGLGSGEDGREAALSLAGRLIANLSAATFEGPGLRVDADLRPEGAMGALSRSLESYRSYYDRWAEGWELQALLKARPVAGDDDLARRFLALAEETIWDRGLDPDSLRSMRWIKQQSEESAAITDLKRFRGGIRDIEFTVQILQLVHGRHDPHLRVGGTLEALTALTDGGYIDEEEHAGLSEGYRFLRDLEHRIQLWDLRQTHDLPPLAEDRARLGRSMRLGPVPETALMNRLTAVKATVRAAHEGLYFRPILDVLVGSSSARLGMDRAVQRLEALGFSDVNAAAVALSELTAGISRRSRAMHQMLPVMLDWLSLAPDPDLGLTQLRNVLAHTPDHSTLISLLQTNPMAGERLCKLLGTGRLLGDLIDRIPEFVPRLADDSLLGDIRGAGDATRRLIGLLDSRPDPDARMGTIRRFVRRRKLRIAARDVLGDATVFETMHSLSDSGDAAVRGAIHVAGAPTSGCAVIAMGKWGGRELSYSSDLDLLYVSGDEDDRDVALRLAAELRQVLSEPSRHGEAFRLDSEIRPEGRKGPLARSLDSYRTYYSRWGEPWEMLALTRARPVAGDPEVMDAFTQMIESVLWDADLSEAAIRSIRAVKARVETERIPAGEDPDYHLKLGQGGLSDVEFLAQLLQLRHGKTHPEVRVRGTADALARLLEADILSEGEYRALFESYAFCSSVRLRLHLQAGRPVDYLPIDLRDLGKLAFSLGFHRATELRDRYRQMTRRARRVFENRFY